MQRQEKKFGHLIQRLIKRGQEMLVAMLLIEALLFGAIIIFATIDGRLISLDKGSGK